MTKALLHIGTPKTGTTSFQAWASANRHLLDTQANIRVYRGLFGANHYELGLLCKRHSRNGFGELEFPDWCLPEWQSQAIKHIRNEVESAKATGQDLLVSSEVLSLLRHDDELQRLRDLLGGIPTRAVAVVREPDSFLRSWRRQIGPGGWSAHRSSAGYTEADSWLIDYPAMAKAFESAFGRGALSLVNYEAALEHNGTVIPAILEALEFGRHASAATAEAQWANASAPKPAAELPTSMAALRAECSQLHRRLELLARERDGLETQVDLGEQEARRQKELVSRLERELSETRHELGFATQAAARSSTTLASITSSASWRLTGPARAAKRIALRAIPGGTTRGRVAVQAAGAASLTAGAAALLLLA